MGEEQRPKTPSAPKSVHKTNKRRRDYRNKGCEKAALGSETRKESPADGNRSGGGANKEERPHPFGIMYAYATSRPRPHRKMRFSGSGG